MSFPMGSQVPQASTSELCLRYPDNVGVHSQISYEQAMSLLTQATEMAQRVPFAWTYIDKPQDGQAYLIFIMPNAITPMPPDGIRWMDQEKSYRLPIHNGRELEVSEVKFGFVPNSEANASRVRRRFRLSKGGNTQLMLVHYLRGDAIPVPAQLLGAPVRTYPLRPSNEPRLYVAGDRMGQRVPPLPHAGPSSLPAAPPVHSAQPNGVGMGLGLGIGGMGQVAALAQQNQAMDALERERRNRGMTGMTGMTGNAARTADEDDSGDEYDNVSTRTLAIGRFKRNHELMAEVFTYASQGHRKVPPPRSPYASFNVDEMKEKMTKLTADVEVLETKAEERRLARAAREAEAEQQEGAEVAPATA